MGRGVDEGMDGRDGGWVGNLMNGGRDGRFMGGWMVVGMGG